MSRKLIFAICLIVAGVIIGLLVLITYGMSGGNTAITLAFLSIAILFVIAGSLLAFSRLLDRTVTPLVEEIHKDIEDDLQDLKERRFTSTHWMVVILALTLAVFSFFVFRLHKVEAAWGPIPVLVPTFIAMLALAWFIPRTNWFRRSRDYTPMWVFFVPTIGFILSLWLGLGKAENLSVLRAAPTEMVSYNTFRPTGIFLDTVGNAADVGLSFGLPDCDGDACGAIILVALLIILTLVLVIGSAFIPHFWILSGSLLLGTMLLIAIHDLRIRRVSQGALAPGP